MKSKVYRMLDSYKFIWHCITGYLANEDDYCIANDMDDFRIRVGYNSEHGVYMLAVFEGTFCERHEYDLTLTDCLEEVKDILDKLANI